MRGTGKGTKTLEHEFPFLFEAKLECPRVIKLMYPVPWVRTPSLKKGQLAVAFDISVPQK
jgi:hypothetical protein